MSRLRQISERLEAIADELDRQEAGEESTAALVHEASELSAEAVEEANRRSREAAAE